MRNLSVHSRVPLRWAMTAVLILGLAVIAPNASAQSGAVVRIDPASSAVAPGATIVVNVRIENVTNLAGAEVHITYDPFLLEAQVEPGGFPAPDFIAQNSATGGRIDFAIARMPPSQPSNGSGVLLKITFKALADGVSPIQITSVLLSDMDGLLITATTQNGSVTVSTATPVPTTPAPTTPAPTTLPPTTPAPSTARVIVVPPSTAPLVNAAGVAAVRIENVANLWGVDFRLTYDASVLQCVDVQTGPTPAADIAAKKMCGNGVVEYAVAQQAPREPASGSGDSLRVTFKCLKQGTSALTLERAALVNRDGMALPATITNAQFTCSGSSSGGTSGKHTVRSGETLFCIGRAYQTQPFAIAATNTIRAPYLVYPGQVLTIPNAPWFNIPPGPVCQRQFEGAPPTVTPTPQPGCRAQYIVNYGDTLLGIARRFGVDVFTLAARNRIYNLNLIFVGQVLCIP